MRNVHNNGNYYTGFPLNRENKKCQGNCQSFNFQNRGEVGKFDNLTLLCSKISICDTAVDNKYFSTGPLMLMFLISK